MSKRDLHAGRTAVRGPNHAALRQAALKVVDRRTLASGSVAFPCIPALQEQYLERLCALWTSLGRPFSAPDRERLREGLTSVLAAGFEHSPHTLLVVNYEANPPPKSDLTYSLQLKERSVESYYAEWSATSEGARFGEQPDAMVLQLAQQLSPGARVLDVGAGHGRNSLPLRKLGLAVDALELVDSLCERMRSGAAQAGLALNVVQGDVLDPQLALDQEAYALIVVSEVVSHFRRLEQLEAALTTLTQALAPGGLLVLNAFLCDEGYTPDKVVREAAQVALSSAFTRAELHSVTRQLPLAVSTDEPMLAYERLHVPSEAWPPTPWFEGWSAGRNIFDLPGQTPPIQLRWLVYRKQPQDT